MRAFPENSRQTMRQGSPRAGTQMVELALVLPIFFVLIFAGVEFFRLSMLQYAENVGRSDHNMDASTRSVVARPRPPVRRRTNRKASCV